MPPIRAKYRAINPALEEDLRKQLDLWLKHDVVERTDCSPWSSNLVAARKRNHGVRWCVDWRRLVRRPKFLRLNLFNQVYLFQNNITKKDAFPMPSVSDNIARLAGSKIFSGFDMAGQSDAIFSTFRYHLGPCSWFFANSMLLFSIVVHRQSTGVSVAT